MKLITCPLIKLQFFFFFKREKKRGILSMQYIRERKKESTQKLIKHTRFGVAMINTEQDNNNVVLFSTIF